MTDKNTGGPAFPLYCGPYDEHNTQGMTLRDYFAAKAMSILWDAYDKGYCGVLNPDEFDNEILAEGAYQIADAMLAERNK